MKKAKKSRRAGLFVVSLMIVAVLVLLYDSNTRLTVDEYPVYNSALPRAFEGYRIAQLSDVHTTVYGDENSVLVDMVEKADPDIIAITGDLVSHSDEAAEALDIVRQLVRQLVDIAPVYYVTGNHEWDTGWVYALLDMLRDNGVTVLRNDYVRLPIGAASIILAGVDDPNGPADMKTPESLVSEIRSQEDDPHIILLGHRNNNLERYSALGIDLVLCGHAHGGLVRLPGIGGLFGPSMDFLPDYTSGIYTDGNTHMLVSRGIGSRRGFPRFLNNPQIPVAILQTE